MEDLRLTATLKGHLQGFQAKLRVKTVGKPSAEDIPGEEIDDRHQVEKTFAQQDVGDVGGPDLIHIRDHGEIHQEWATTRWITREVMLCFW